MGFQTQLHRPNVSKQNHFLFSKAKSIIFNVSDVLEKEQTPGSGSFMYRTVKMNRSNSSCTGSIGEEGNKHIVVT